MRDIPHIHFPRTVVNTHRIYLYPVLAAWFFTALTAYCLSKRAAYIAHTYPCTSRCIMQDVSLSEDQKHQTHGAVSSEQGFEELTFHLYPPPPHQIFLLSHSQRDFRVV